MHSSLKKPKFENELRSSLNVHYRTTHSSVVNYFVLKTEICKRTMRSSLNRTVVHLTELCIVRLRVTMPHNRTMALSYPD